MWHQRSYQIALKQGHQNLQNNMIASFSFTSTAHVTQWLNYPTQRADLTIKFNTSTGKEYCEWFVRGTKVAFDLAPPFANRQNCSHNTTAKHIKISCLPRESSLNHSWSSWILPQVIRDIHISPRLLCSWFLAELDYCSKLINISTCIHRHPGMPGYKKHNGLRLSTILNPTDFASFSLLYRIGCCLTRASQQLYTARGHYRKNSGLEKKPVRSSRTSRFFLRASNFLFLLAPRARTQARRSPTKFLITILRRKGKLYWFKGHQVFRWRLTKITSYSVVLLIAWHALMAQKWLPCTWSKSAPIEFLSRIKIAALGMKTLRL